LSPECPKIDDFATDFIKGDPVARFRKRKKTREKEKYKTKSPTIARKSRPYRLRPKPRVRFPVTERKRFVKDDTVPCTLC